PHDSQAYNNPPPPQGPGPHGMHIAPPGSQFYADPNQSGNGGMYSQEIGGYQMSLSNCRGRKKALFIGINYFNTDAELKGCINDVKNISSFLIERKGFKQSDCVFLTDDQQDPKFIPTYANIQAACNWLVKGANPGDSLFVHYSGHGGTQKDTNGDEADGFDETILPIDYKEAGQIPDDLLNEWLVQPLPQGVRLTAVFDSCHSGTVLDLPYTYNCDGSIQVITSDNRKEAAMTLLNAGMSFQQGDSMKALQGLVQGFKMFTSGGQANEADKLTKETKGTTADVVMFSGCRDDQTSADAQINNQATGAMSHALIEVLTNSQSLVYTELLFSIRDILKSKYKQIPQMSTGRPMDMNTEFII
ncbi:caspase domain-containing protein, partial [Dimargaris cristalligena]